MEERIIVTGGDGFIGRHLVRKLQKGYRVKVIDKTIFPYHDLSSYSSIRNCFERYKPTTVFDLATLPLVKSLESPYYTTYRIYNMGINLCELAREGYYKRLIHISSSEVYGTGKIFPMAEIHELEPRTPYAAAKAAQDMLILSYINAFNIDAAIARPFNTYGPGQDLGAIIPATIKSILKRKRPVITGSGEQIRDFIYVEDTVRGIIAIWKNEDARGRIINIANGNPISIYNLVKLIIKLMVSKTRIRYIDSRMGDVYMHHADTNRALSIMNFKARVQLEDGLKRTIKWWEKQSSI